MTAGYAARASPSKAISNRLACLPNPVWVWGCWRESQRGTIQSDGLPAGATRVGEVLSLLDNETGMHSCLEPKPQASPVGAGGKRRHPRAHENTGIGADEPEA